MNPFFQVVAAVQENILLARDTYRIRLHAPELAWAIRPGQFVMLRLPGHSDPLLGRPFALYDTVLSEAQEPIAVDIVYLVVGKLTGLLAQLRPTDRVEMWGPLGNGFPLVTGLEHIALVAGGIGQTPFLAYLRALFGQRGYGGVSPQRYTQTASLYYGVRSAELMAGVEDFQSTGAQVHLSTDDGTLGYHGLVTELLQEHLANPSRVAIQHLVGCGPEPMLKALASLADQNQLPCQVSLETPMACGVGICFSCVTPVRTGTGSWDYHRVCVDGPVFDAATLVWENPSGR